MTLSLYHQWPLITAKVLIGCHLLVCENCNCAHLHSINPFYQALLLEARSSYRSSFLNSTCSIAAFISFADHWFRCTALSASTIAIFFIATISAKHNSHNYGCHSRTCTVSQIILFSLLGIELSMTVQKLAQSEVFAKMQVIASNCSLLQIWSHITKEYKRRHNTGEA